MGIDLHGTWTLVELDDQTPARGLRGPAHLTFDGDGQVYGMAGVNSVRGTWTLDGGTLVLGPLAATLVAGDPGPTATEHALLALLRERLQVTVDEDRLRLAADDGSTALLARTDPSDVLL